ncbi:MAG: hypothetical protein IPK63_00705 [Candidatus Competibacteraceae bacterium]|nr:hypothetical protein [Candidatus Competibacteraceae bacterium]
MTTLIDRIERRGPGAPGASPESSRHEGRADAHGRLGDTCRTLYSNQPVAVSAADF